MNDRHYVIIGNGACANRAADTLRQHDQTSRVSLISDEFFPFYYRHMLPKYITGEKEEAELIVRPPSYYKENNIRLRLGQQVMKVDMDTHTLYLRHMEKVHFSHLLLCTGGIPKIPEIYHTISRFFFTLKTLSDARKLKQALKNCHKLTLVGGDLVSFKMALALAGSGLEIHYLMDQQAFWPLDLNEDQQQQLGKTLTQKGIKVISGTLKNISPSDNDQGYLVQTHEGEEVQTDLVGAFFGLKPNIEFLYGTGLDIERGILVDEHLQTNIDNVYAAGDCAQVYNPSIKNYWVSIGWSNAERLGALAAENMLGDHKTSTAPKASLLNIDGIKVSSEWWKEFSHDE